MITQLQLDLIIRFLHYTTEAFDDWDWDGQMLTIWLNNEPIERYLLADVREFIRGFK